MPSLYTQRDTNVRKTWLLFAAFFGVVIGVAWVFAQVYRDPSILYFGVIFSVVMNIVAYWYSDRLVLAMTKAAPVSRESHRELYRIVENLCITAGLPVPKIYIVPERQPNAFATGRDPKHAVVAVTQGLLERLDRAELEGVLAHELSHIGNRDMLLSTAAIVLVGFISIVSDMFMRSLWFTPSSSRGGDDEDRDGNQIALLVGIALAILAPIAATLMRLAISRKREFLADASGALLTRYPEGLARALEKIANDPAPMRHATNTTAHLWFDDPFDDPTGRRYRKTPWFHKMFMSHPPVEERLRALRRT